MALCIVIRPSKHEVKEVQIKNFRDIQKEINTEIFDVVSRQIGTNEYRVYDIYVDDIGLLKPNPQVSAWGPTDNSTLVGDILVSLTDYKGDMVDLSQDDINYIKDHCHTVINLDGGEEVIALFPIYYPTIG